MTEGKPGRRHLTRLKRHRLHVVLAQPLRIMLGRDLRPGVPELPPTFAHLEKRRAADARGFASLVPEPTTGLLVMGGVLGLAVSRRRAGVSA